MSAPVQDEPEKLVCNRIKVFRTSVRDISINMALQEMWKNDFIEKDSEKRALSKEDRVFLNEMKREIEFSEGHYILPLPLRKETKNTTTANAERVLQRKR